MQVLTVPHRHIMRLLVRDGRKLIKHIERGAAVQLENAVGRPVRLAIPVVTKEKHMVRPE